MLELPSPFSCEPGVVRLLEERGMAPAVLLNNLLCDEYDRPFVFDDGQTRSLYFSLEYVQSSMRTSDPIALEFAYTRKMMSFLLFQHRTRNILMLGLGGGSLAKYCYAHLPQCRIDVVEIDPYVIGFREQFFIPANDSRFNVIHDDAATYMERCPSRPDVIMLDAFDRNGFAGSIDSQAFYRKARAVLSPSGMLIANLAGARSARMEHLAAMRKAFDDKLLITQIGDDGNHVVIAFRNESFEPRWRRVETKAKALRNRYSIDFSRIAQKFERSQKLGYLDRIMKAH
jgi:spermidine synthase